MVRPTTNCVSVSWRKIDMSHEFEDLADTDDGMEDVPAKEFDDELEHADISGLSAVELEQLLHELSARRLVEAMRQAGPSPGTINAALRFLKDNEITGLDIPGSAQEALRDAMNKKAPFKLVGTE